MRIELEGPTAQEMADLFRLSQAIDDLLEESVRERENVSQTLRRCFPRILEMTGARAIAVTTKNEEQLDQTYSEGDFGGVFPGSVLSGSGPGVRRLGGSAATRSRRSRSTSAAWRSGRWAWSSRETAPSSPRHRGSPGW